MFPRAPTPLPGQARPRRLTPSRGTACSPCLRCLRNPTPLRGKAQPRRLTLPQEGDPRRLLGLGQGLHMFQQLEAGLPGLIAGEEGPAPQQVLPRLVPLGLAGVGEAEGKVQAARPGPTEPARDPGRWPPRKSPWRKLVARNSSYPCGWSPFRVSISRYLAERGRFELPIQVLARITV